MADELRTIEEYSADEHALIMNAKADHGDWFVFANNCMSLLDTGVIGFGDRRRVFGGFWSQVTMHTLLALLSTLRKHSVQSSMNMRHVSEYACLAAYALVHPDRDLFTKMKDGFHVPVEEAKKKSYVWLDQIAPIQMGRLEFIRKQISGSHGHANLRNSTATIQFADDGAKFIFSFFDETHDDYVPMGLFRIGFLCITILEMLNIVDGENRLVVFGSHYAAEFARLYGQMQELFARTDWGEDGDPIESVLETV